MTPDPAGDAVAPGAIEGVNLGRMKLAKTFEGDLVATSAGEMIGARTPIANSAGYVAIEQVVGTLAGRSGSFVLHHKGTMARGESSLDVTVVPDSGTGELKGLSGRMTIDIVEGKHLYVLHYEFAPV